MATATQFRKLALSLPDTEEGFHVDHADFRVRGKIFAGLTKDEKGASMKLSLPTQAAMASADPDAFVPASGAWGRAGWTMVKLSALAIGALEDLVREAHEIIGASARARPKKKAAPKKTPKEKTANKALAPKPTKTIKKATAKRSARRT